MGEKHGGAHPDPECVELPRIRGSDLEHAGVDDRLEGTWQAETAETLGVVDPGETGIEPSAEELGHVPVRIVVREQLVELVLDELSGRIELSGHGVLRGGVARFCHSRRGLSPGAPLAARSPDRSS